MSSDQPNDEPMVASEARFNASALDMLMRIGNHALVVRMIDLFLQNATERIQSARDGVMSGDRRAVQLASHSLKSSAAQLGGPGLQRASLAVEQIAATGEPDVVAAGIDAMQAEFDLLRDWLTVRRAEMESGDNSSNGAIS